MRNLTDLEIIESVKKGNQSDFSLIIDRYKNRAFSLLIRILKNEMDAEEVLQDCFLKTYNSLSSFRKESKFSTWFYRIVYNTAMTRVSGKKRNIEKNMSSVDDHLDLESGYDYHTTEEMNMTEFINSIVGKLPAKYASVINMFYLNEMSCEEISEVTGTSVANVKVLLHRSRNSLREMMEKMNIKEEFYD
jgi:RNA polymerase sigma factor (sigma-70 family)